MYMYSYGVEHESRAEEALHPSVDASVRVDLTPDALILSLTDM